MDIKEDAQKEAYSNDGLEPLFLSKIEEIVKDQHIINKIKRCFVEDIIKYSYFQNHRRKDFVVLLMRKYKIKQGIAMKLWTVINNNNNNFVLETNNDEIKVQSVCLEPATLKITKQAVIYKQPAIDTVSLDNNTSNHVYCKKLLAAKSIDTMDSKQADGDDSDAEGVPQRVVTATDDDIKEVKRLTKIQFKPKYPARAHLNIFTAKELTKELRDVIDEEFDNELILYYYMDISTALQINDHQMTEYTLLMNEYECKLSIINYDLHIKGTGQCLYGVIVPNDNYTMQQNEWLWKLEEFMNAEQIERKYKIKQHELPKSSPLMQHFQKQLGQILVIEESLIDDTDWFKVQQIKSLKRNVKVPKITVTLSKEIWMTECKKSFQNVDLPLIPVVVNKNNNHWIEWIKIIYIESQNIYVGISCKYDEYNNKWSVQSIYLDPSDIYNKHRLVGLKRDKYSEQLKNFKTSITEIKFSDNESKDIDKKINTLKQQIKYQQDSIVHLKESLLRVKNANKYNHHNGFGYDHDTDTKIADNDTWFDQIVDVFQYKTKSMTMGQVYGTLVRGYCHQYVDDVDSIKLVTLYLASFDILRLIKLSLINNKINWSDLKLIKYQSRNNDGIDKTVSISEKAMNDFCFMALERLNDNYNDNLIQFGEIERILNVHVIDDNGSGDIGISFVYTHKSDNLFVAASIYSDKTEIKFIS